MSRVLILIPDGVGLRNFLNSDFLKIAKQNGLKISIWTDSDFFQFFDNDIHKISLSRNRELSFLSNFFRIIWSKAMIQNQARIFNNRDYLLYIFTSRKSKLAQRILDLVETCILKLLRFEYLIKLTRHFYLILSKKSRYYQFCKKQLEDLKPDFVFCVIQRSSKAIAPMLAAKALHIKNSCFIYSWDNLPKATVFVDSENYFVWSEQMKNDFDKYYTKIIGKRNLHITGTPQFETYFSNDVIIEKSNFAELFNLPLENKWICFSGDDISTSPFDQLYLGDLCKAVLKWNDCQSDKIHIIFRPCPVDLSNRYDYLLQEYGSILTKIKPDWTFIGSVESWDRIVPNKFDNNLLVSIVTHCDCVVNLGSTMAFDFAVLNKPTIYLNYNFEGISSWDVHNIYKFIHFQTINNLKPVIWANDNNSWQLYLEKSLYDYNQILIDCQSWHKQIACYPLNKTNERIIQSIFKILKC